MFKALLDVKFRVTHTCFYSFCLQDFAVYAHNVLPQSDIMEFLNYVYFGFDFKILNSNFIFVFVLGLLHAQICEYRH